MQEDELEESSVMTVLHLSILYVFRCIHNIKERVESSVQKCRIESKEATRLAT